MLTWTDFQNIEWERKASYSPIIIMCSATYEKRREETKQKMLSHIFYILCVGVCAHRENSGRINTLLIMLEEKSCEENEEQEVT